MSDRTELQWLSHDLLEYRRILGTNKAALAPLGDTTDPDRHTRYLVIADLWWRIWDLAGAIALLLEHEFYTPAVPLIRAQFDALATVGYLAKHPNAQDESVIFLAYSYIKQCEHFAHQAELVNELSGILARMPGHLVAKARCRASRRPHTWSGLTNRKLAATGDVTGYDQAYGYFSGETHASLPGQYVRIVPTGNGMATIQTGTRVQAEDVESMANFARRSLHSAFKVMWAIFDAPPIRINSKNPADWPPPG